MYRKPVVLIVLDGWGISEKKEANAIASAHAPVYRSLIAACPHTKLQAAGEAVGLPDGQMGNSEVGHLNLGAGRVVYQDSTRISKAVREGDFFKNPVLMSAMESAKRQGAALHLMALLSDGGVHSRLDHIFAMLDMAKSLGVQNVFFHAFLDGRDTPPSSALEYIARLESHLAKIGIGKIATISGRYYAMDRDKRWDRVEKAYAALVKGEGAMSYTAAEAVKKSYENGRTDEFMMPTVIIDARSRAVRWPPLETATPLSFAISDRIRAREITKALTDPSFDGFKRNTVPALCSLLFASLPMMRPSISPSLLLP